MSPGAQGREVGQLPVRPASGTPGARHNRAKDPVRRTHRMPGGGSNGPPGEGPSRIGGAHQRAPRRGARDLHPAGPSGRQRNLHAGSPPTSEANAQLGQGEEKGEQERIPQGRQGALPLAQATGRADPNNTPGGKTNNAGSAGHGRPEQTGGESAGTRGAASIRSRHQLC